MATEAVLNAILNDCNIPTGFVTKEIKNDYRAYRMVVLESTHTDLHLAVDASYIDYADTGSWKQFH